MKKIYTLLLLFTITLFYSIPTQAFDIPLNYGVSDNDQAFVQTKNLFDKTTTNLLMFVNTTTGDLNVAGSTDTSDFIQVTPNTTYTLSNATSGFLRNMGFYDNTFNYITFLGYTTTVTFTTSATTHYLRFGLTLGSLNTAQLELGSTATSYTPYGFLSLNDIFVDGQVIDNADYDDGTTNWNAVSGTGSVTNGIYSFTASAQYGRVTALTPSFTSAKQYFIVARVKATSTSITLGRSSNSTTGNFGAHSGSGYYELLSGKWTPLTTTDGIAVKDSRASAWDQIDIDYVFGYDLNALGIDHLTQNELRALYNDWLFNYFYDLAFTDGELSSEAYANGFTAGYEVGYGDGYTDAVEEDNAYALGFAKGLLEGTDMETGSSLLILIVALIGFVMMIFGFTTKRGIFNLLSVAAFVVLGGLLIEFVGFIIITFGLVLINIYYAFFGDL
jgi:hypothetical protein